MPALLDTGAPQTIINRAAAAAARITVGGGAAANANDAGGGKRNPLAGLFDAFNKVGGSRAGLNAADPRGWLEVVWVSKY